MSEITVREPITVSARSSNTIAAEIVAITNQARQMAVMAAIEVGKRLVEAKELVGHGEWGAYVERECLMSHRSANNCMKLFREWEQNPNSQALANLSYTNAVRLLALPEDDREELMQEHDVANMSSRDLEKTIKERDQLKAAKETADAEIRDLQQQLLDAQQTAANAKSSEAAWQEEIDKLKENLTKARNQMQYYRDNPTIPKATKDKLVTDAKAQGVKEAEKKLQAQLEAAEQKAKEATAARATAEQAARDAEAKLQAAQKQSQFASPDTAAFKVLFDQLQSDFNKLNGHLMKITAADAEQGEKFKGALRTLVEEMRKRVV